MNVHDLVTAAGLVGGDVGRAVPALVRVAICAGAARHDCGSCEPGRRGEPCDCPTEALEAAVRDLEALLGPLPLPPEPTP